VVPGARLVLLGKQGAGKGTQCVALSRHYVIAHISTGEIIDRRTRKVVAFVQPSRQYVQIEGGW